MSTNAPLSAPDPAKLRQRRFRTYLWLALTAAFTAAIIYYLSKGSPGDTHQVETNAVNWGDYDGTADGRPFVYITTPADHRNVNAWVVIPHDEDHIYVPTGSPSFDGSTGIWTMHFERREEKGVGRGLSTWTLIGDMEADDVRGFRASVDGGDDTVVVTDTADDDSPKCPENPHGAYEILSTGTRQLGTFIGGTSVTDLGEVDLGIPSCGTSRCNTGYTVKHDGSHSYAFVQVRNEDPDPAAGTLFRSSDTDAKYGRSFTYND